MLGDRYNAALFVVRESSLIREVFGDILEIRPALGTNNYSSWMDSTSVFLTLRVQGTRGEGAVIVQGDDCFNLEMVVRRRSRWRMVAISFALNTLSMGKGRLVFLFDIPYSSVQFFDLILAPQPVFQHPVPLRRLRE